MASKSGSLHFVCKNRLHVFHLSYFLFDLDFAYQAVSLFHKLDNVDDIKIVIDSIEKGRFPVQLSYRQALSKRGTVVNDKHGTDVLSVQSITINSPADLKFIGDLNPINNIKDVFVEMKQHQRWKAEHELAKQAQTQKLQIEREEFKQKQKEQALNRNIKKAKAKQEIETERQLIELRRLDIIQKKVEILKSMAIPDTQIQTLVQSAVIWPVERLVRNNPLFDLPPEG